MFEWINETWGLQMKSLGRLVLVLIIQLMVEGDKIGNNFNPKLIE